ncbi:MAG: hypothetical protein ABIH85_02770 [Candidatus Omnitrophota bacterium]|nr:hypothetical protein [Candidatus Omnitrophota bacterium]MBU1894333.1 hypothetical protein [Candidatus Omnitrophota bacterium]
MQHIDPGYPEPGVVQDNRDLDSNSSATRLSGASLRMGINNNTFLVLCPE